MIGSIAEHALGTAVLASVALVVAIVSGGFFGVVRARLRVRPVRDALAVLELVARSVPVFVAALAVILAAIFTPISPNGIAAGNSADVGDRVRHLLFPVFALALPFGAWVSCLFHDSLRAHSQDGKPAVRDLLRPAAESIALIGPALLAGTVFVEGTFAWRGLSSLLGALSRDAATIAGFLLVYALMSIVLKLIGHVWLARLSSSSGRNCVLDAARRARPRFFGNWIAVLGLVLCVLFALAALASMIPSLDPNTIDIAHWQGYPLAPGVAGHLLGTDENGRDLLARLLIGLRTSLAIAVLAALAATAIGVAIARVTKVLPWLSDDGAQAVAGIRSFAAFPFVAVAAGLILYYGHSLGPVAEALVLAVVTWPALVAASRRSSSEPRSVLAAVVSVTAAALLLEVTLSFTRLGVQPPEPSLGNMLVNTVSLFSIAPWIVALTVGLIVAALFALNAVADGLRDQ